MRTTVVAVAVLAALAGCLGGNEDSPTVDDDGQSPVDGNVTALPTEAFEFAEDISGCSSVELLLPAAASDVEAHAPPGFSVPDPTVVVLGAMTCGLYADEMQRGFWAFRVTPDDPILESSRAANHYWIAEHYVRNGTTFAATLERLHATVVNGTAVASNPLAGPYLTVASDGVRYHWTSNGPSAPDAWGPLTEVLSRTNTFREYFAADGGYAYIDATFGGAGDAAAAPGVLTTQGDTAAADFYGASMPMVGLFNDGMSYAGALLGYIPYP